MKYLYNGTLCKDKIEWSSCVLMWYWSPSKKKKKSSWGGNENLFWQETEETASGYIFGWWGGNGEMRDERILPDGKSWECIYNSNKFQKVTNHDENRQ